MRDTFEKFSFPTIGLHWIIALGMIAMLAFGLYLEDLPRSPEKGSLMGLHKSFGLLILVLASLRIVWRIRNKFPKPLSPLVSWQEKLAKFTHWLLIVGTVLMPVSGVLMSIGGGHSLAFFGMELIAEGGKNEMLDNIGHVIHGLGSKLLIAFIILHAVAAVKHQFMDKDGTLSRMIGKKVNPGSNQV